MMKCYRACFFYLFLLLATTPTLYAQTPEQPTKIDVIPPSPEASALGRYGQVPVSLYTGVPNIELPLYTVQEKNLSVPLSLSYHAGGNRVTDVASRTGLGWSLNGQSVISRTVRGLQDDPYYFSTLDFIGVNPHEVNTLPNDKQFDMYLGAAVSKCRDLEPDEFSFNIAGRYSGTFVFNENKQIIVSSASKIRFEPTFTSGRITAWTVTGEDGTQYFFDVTESTYIQNFSRTNEFACTGNNTTEYISSWHLRKITAVNPANFITFIYSDYLLNHQHERGESDQHLVNLSVGGCTDNNNAIVRSIYTMEIRGKQLASITTSSGTTKVEFKGTTLRTDVAGTNLYQLNQIVVSNAQAKTIRTYQLGYDYSSGRLTLKTLTESAGGVSKPPHQFTYNSLPLPARSAYTQDLWGYYNSNPASTLLLPTRILYETGFSYLEGANRNPDAVKMQAAMLQKLTYPTGGTTSFTYEPHTYSYEENIRLTDKAEKEYKKVLMSPPTYQVAVEGNGTNQPVLSSLPFTVYSHSAAQVVVKVEGLLDARASGGFVGCAPRVYIKNSAGNKVFEKVVNGTGENATLSINENIFLPSGSYTMYAQAMCTFEELRDYAEIGATWENDVEELVIEKMAGGLRVKEMVDFDGLDHSRDQKTTYDYTLIDQGKTLSSGSLIDISNTFAYETEKSVGGPACPISGAVARFLNRVTASVQSRATQGCPVGYRQVTVYTGPVDKQGKSVSHYTSPFSNGDMMSDALAFPFPAAASQEFRRGLLTDQETYRNTNGSWALIRKDTNTYRFEEYTIPALKVGLFKASNSLMTDADIYRFGLSEYVVTLGFSQLTSQKSYQYDETGRRMTTLQSSGYSPTHRQLTYRSQQQSDGTQLVTKLSYPSDYPLTTPSGVAAQAISAMQSKHVLSPVVEKQVWLKRSATDSSLVSAQLTNYRQLSTGDIVAETQLALNQAAPLALSATSSSTTTTFMPARISSGVFSFDAKYQARLQYEKYDALANLQQARESNGIALSFIWGYNGAYPLAQVKNADWTAITTALGQISTTESALFALTDAATIRTKMEQLRAKLPQAHLSCYTYDPLVGMNSATDANNQTSYYEYDGLGRLADVKDFNGDIIQDYQYHYKGQPEEKFVPKTSIIAAASNNATNTDLTNQVAISGPILPGPHVYYSYKDHTYNKLYLIGYRIQVIDFNTLTDEKPTSRLYTDVGFTKVQKLENQIHTAGNKIYIGTQEQGLYVIHRQTGVSEMIDLLAGTAVVHDNTKINSVVIDNASNLLYAPVVYRVGTTEYFYGLLEMNLSTNAKRWITSTSSGVQLPTFSYVNYWNGYKVDLDQASNTLYLSGSFGLWWWNRTTNETGLYNASGGLPLLAGNPQLPDNRVTMNFIDLVDNKFYIGTSNGLLVWNRQDNTSRVYTSANSKLTNNEINHISKYEELGLVFVATESGGLFTLNTLTGEEKLYTQGAGNETAPQLMDNGVESVYFDALDKKLYATGWKVGGVWIRDYKTMLPYNQAVPTAQDQNWVTTTAVRSAGVKTRAEVSNVSVARRSQSISYLDGLGRPIQQVQTSASPLVKDVVQALWYDAVGREPLQYLPYATTSSNGGYQADALLTATTGKAIDFYSPTRPTASTDARASDAAPYAESIFEASPLNRVLEQGAPGASWQVLKSGGNSTLAGKTQKLLERTNLASEVLRWTYGFASSDNFGTVQATQYYAAGELMVKQTTDEHGNQTRQFTDKAGQVLSKKVQFQGGTTPAETDFLTTCYVYDDLGQLRMVVQPEGVAKVGTLPFTPTSDFLDQWCFTYHYDAQRRMVEKKVPGSEAVRMIYNGRDELVLTQDGSQRVRKEWSFTKYDALGRPVMTGIYANSQQTSRTDVQTLANASTGVNLYEEPVAANATNHGYTNRAFPVGGVGTASTWIPALGKHSLSVTPYSTADATGTKGATTVLNFNVVQTGTYTDNTLPTLTVSTTPAATAPINAGTSITLTAAASDADGIAKVEFFSSVAGGLAQKLGEKTTPTSGTNYTYAWTPSGGTYLLTVKATDTKGGVTTKTLANVTVRGSILREVWSNLPGDLVANTNLVSGNQPTSSSQLATLEAPSNTDEYFGSRIRGYLTPPTTGSYTFGITGDDNCELYLSSSSDPAGKVKIADITTVGTDNHYTGSGEWNKYPSQKSGSIALTAGTYYYIEVVHKENDRGDNVAVGWKLTSAAGDPQVIAGSALTTFVPNLPPTVNAGLDQALQLSGTNTTVSTSLSGSGVDLDGTLTYAWQQRGGPVLATLSGATTANLGLSGLVVGAYLFRLTVTDNSGASEYDEVVLKVEAAPTQSVSSLQLVDGNNPATVLKTLTNASTIVLSDYPTVTSFNIKAVTAPTSVGSVQFTLDGTPSTSNAAPYLLSKASPASEYVVYTVNYYDSYDFNRNGTLEAAPNKESYQPNFQTEFTAAANEPLPTAFSRVVGKSTGGKVRVLNAAGNTAVPEAWLWSSAFYDERGQLVQAQSDNHLSGLDISTVQYHFSGRIVRAFLKHTNTTTTNPSLSIKQRSVYDHASRVTEVYQQTNGEAEEPISKNSYNELGQLISKKVGTDGSKELQSIDYRYNIRGWLTLINDAGLSGAGDLFGMRLLYDDAPTGNKQYNGNIGSMQWISNFDRKGRNFKYQYDAANRLTEAAWSNPSPTTGDFSVNGITYDRNGNILSFNQNGLSSRKDNASPLFEAIDRLKYGYQGNRLNVVEDGISNQGLAGDFQDGNQQAVNPIAEYTYDANGNMYEDKNKGIRSIVYNRLNLPATILMDNGGGNRIEYMYDASGTKLRKEVYQGGSLMTTTDYVGGLVFENKELQFVPTPEGRALTGKLAGTSGFAYEYHYKDHLGNLRMAFRKSKTLRTYTATMEVGNPKEAEFANVNDLTRDGTYYQGSTGVKSAKLSTTQVLGPWKTIKVSRGDRVEAKVYAHYDGDAAASGGVSLQVYLGGAGMTGGSTESGNNLPLLKNVGLGLSIVPNPSTTTLPKAYLKYIFYDSEGNYVSSSYKPVTTAAKGANNNTVWQEIKFSDANTVKDAFWADQNGTLQVMVVNESNVPVWFDNLEIAHQEAMIVQENHYSPFGLNLVGIETQGQPNHQYQYNGKEKQEELGLNWIDYGWRNYDPQLARWHSKDALAEKYDKISPYVYCANNPIIYIDPDGRKLNVSDLLNSKEGLYALLNIMTDLNKITGMSLSVSKKDGNLQELNDGKRDSQRGGSGEARGYLRNIMNTDEVQSVGIDNSKETRTNVVTNKITINTNEIDDNIKSVESAGLNSLTYGYGMVVLHETMHTKTGSKYYGIEDSHLNDDSYNGGPGNIERKLNTFRSEINLPTLQEYQASRKTLKFWEFGQNFKKPDGTIINVVQDHMTPEEKKQRRQQTFLRAPSVQIPNKE